ncbi:NUDIX domain-containing protein [Sphingobacteriaceae bacterium WQ 2009]|uniref:NUDIX domain-containing protein n=1 Tax=Rhinopithecimicrobium faecis TaxID=2820698 RepID=A0A8T4HCB1_9SPHI|nr:NUDIX domain-containing protein [Sphingobacteriaceae bacterium WQ 2009]
MYPFNVRVYGLLINTKGQVLIADEKTENVSFTKFPGGGLEYGEGLIDALKREFMEECNTSIEVIRHIYTTDFWEKSSFNESQIISIYYLVRATSPLAVEVHQEKFDFDQTSVALKQEAFRLVDREDLKIEDLTFRTDQVAWNTYLTSYQS